MSDATSISVPDHRATSAFGERALPWHSYVTLLFPRDVERGLERVRQAGLVPVVPNLWQLELGVLRMWHRIVFRSETVGTSKQGRARPSLRAKLFAYRPLRFPFLLRERAVAPLDLSGLLSSRERIIRHLLGAHHDGNQFTYDLELMLSYPGALEELRARALEVVSRDDARSRFLRDLVVYDGYHESLLRAVERALAGDLELPPGERDDPDISFRAYLRWCARQPESPSATLSAWQAGRFDLQRGLLT